MMRKRVLGLILVCIVFLLAACGKTGNEASKAEEQEKSNTTSEEKVDDKSAVSVEEGITDEKKEADESISEGAEEMPEPVTVKVYYSNADATAFVSEEVQVENLTPEEVLRVLVDKGVVTADVEILSFKETEADGKPALEIDFNRAFGDYVSGMGTTGEYYILGGLCNTFLETYGCERIKFTVEGNVLTTGHAEYPGYLSMFS